MTAKTKTLVDRLWALIEPALQPGQTRSPERVLYRLHPQSPPVLHQAEGLLVALETKSLKDAFTAYVSSERWAALTLPHPTSHKGYEVKSLLYIASTVANERIAMALPGEPRDDATVEFKHARRFLQ